MSSVAENIFWEDYRTWLVDDQYQVPWKTYQRFSATGLKEGGAYPLQNENSSQEA